MYKDSCFEALSKSYPSRPPAGVEEVKREEEEEEEEHVFPLRTSACHRLFALSLFRLDKCRGVCRHADVKESHRCE